MLTQNEWRFPIEDRRLFQLLRRYASSTGISRFVSAFLRGRQTRISIREDVDRVTARHFRATSDHSKSPHPSYSQYARDSVPARYSGTPRLTRRRRAAPASSHHPYLHSEEVAP
ncbi:hypothetical protein CBM2586_B130517 [Cupriavidus phytorum]|uniref:Transposase n=1 Tax=Cupriavidus taiwanensis TaxID=164546 RepID=A0A375CJG2_9BURK|nr:hypothetical protein CBM2586_B130517 [Cupriavidus taiwanensis]